jgi:hypothetical protein
MSKYRCRIDRKMKILKVKEKKKKSSHSLKELTNKRVMIHLRAMVLKINQKALSSDNKGNRKNSILMLSEIQKVPK